MSAPLVSICLPNLNHRPFLQDRMDTILAQTIQDWELIVGDSHSDDGSWEFFQNYKDDPRVRLYQIPRAGIYAGWNECLRRATGKYIYIATSDDTMRPDCLEKLLRPLEKLPALKLAVSDFQEIDENGNFLGRRPRLQHLFLGEWMKVPCIRNGQTEFLLHVAFRQTIWTTMASVLFDRRLLQSIGYFRTDLGSRGDEEWTLRASLASDIAYVPEKLSTWRVHAGQATGKWDPIVASAWLLTALQSVLNDPQSGIPPEWQSIPDWRRVLSEAHEFEYRQSFKLYRWEAKRNPRAFWRGCWQALKINRPWLWHQIRSGFTAPERRELEPGDQANELIRIFHAAWPPQAVAGDW